MSIVYRAGDPSFSFGERSRKQQQLIKEGAGLFIKNSEAKKEKKFCLISLVIFTYGYNSNLVNFNKPLVDLMHLTYANDTTGRRRLRPLIISTSALLSLAPCFFRDGFGPGNLGQPVNRRMQ